MDNKSLDALFSGLTETNAQAPPEGMSVPQQERAEQKTKATMPYRARQKQKELERQEVRLCTIVSSELVKKIRAIANIEGMTIRSVVEAAFQKAISSYERKHGEIKEECKKNLKDLF